MKVSKALKIAAVIILLHSLLFLWMIVSGLGTGVGGLPPINMLIYLAWGTAAFIIAIGLLRAKKTAVYAVLVFSILRFLFALKWVFVVSSQKGEDILNPFLVVFYAIVTCLSISCIIRERKQSKIR